MDFHLTDWLDECSDRNLLLRPRGNHKDFPNCLSTEQKQPIVAPWQQWQLNAEIQKAGANYLWTAASWLRLWTTPLSAGTYSCYSFFLTAKGITPQIAVVCRSRNAQSILFLTNLHCCHFSKDAVSYGICKQQHCDCSWLVEMRKKNTFNEKKLFTPFKPCVDMSLLPHQQNKLLPLQLRQCQLNSNTMTR